ncbi:MAG TPA: FtsW/RodA/SpoVE family cell cycle protein [Dehalococcoidia bacterium]|nr:FtsW/RodA/SpoVE family cell cycle protein [Dehalococcoidia bacterium]
MVLRRRPNELLLLLLVCCFLGVALYSLQQSLPEARNHAMSLAAGFCLSFLAGHFALCVLSPECDEVLLPLVALLSAVGLVFALRLGPASASLAEKQLIWLALGLLLMLATVRAMNRYAVLRQYQYLAAFAGIGLMAVTALIGKEINGSRLWLGFGGFYFQVTEAMKLLLVIFLAGYLADRRYMLAAVSARWRAFRVPTLPYLLPLAVIWAFTLALMAWQHDLGAMLLLMSVTLLLLYVASGRWAFVVAGLLIVAVNLWVAYHAFGYVHSRIDLWLHPLSSANGTSQIAESIYAFASGGVLGTGLGHGSPLHIPVVQTDFVFAAIGEELGSAGAMALIACYLVLAFRGLRIGMRQPADFGMLLAVGATAILAIQAIVIAAGDLALIPITGITLPFVSYGGSSIVVNFVLLGLLLRLSTSRPLERPAG